MPSSKSEPDIALILAAAGSGSRFDSKKPKQYLEILDMPLYMWSVYSFATNKNISRLIIVTREDGIAAIKETIKIKLKDLDVSDSYKKISVIAGGATRQESVYKGLQYLEKNPPDYVLIHDAARPFITSEQIDLISKEIIQYGAALLATPVTDTIKKADKSLVSETVDRSNLICAQTPQGGQFDWLLKGHQKAHESKITVTDDASILEAENHPVRVVEGDKTNIKITVKEDLVLGIAIAKNQFGQIIAKLAKKNNLRSDFKD